MASSTRSNSGVGPAEIESVRVTVDGKPASDWDDVLRQATGAARPHISSFMQGRVLAPGADFHPMKMSPSPGADAMAAESNRVNVEICYCSSLHECWKLSGALRPVSEVASCPLAADHFQQ